MTSAPTTTTLRDRLLTLADPAYRQFNARLIPGATNLLGIRIPELRRIAREIARGDWRLFLDTAESLYFEERMVQGFVIGYARCPVEEKLGRVARFIPLIDNWALCDCFCWRLRSTEREAMWRFIQPYFAAEDQYGVRFAVVMGLTNFIDKAHLEKLLAHLGAIRREEYYVRMAVAWAVSFCFVKFPTHTRQWLDGCRLDDWTFNKSLQKIRESLRVDAATKEELRQLARHRTAER